ncbi:hypothetical protein S7711_11538 [Stachybotrys chartarum IBT 7711]|uniref:Chromo domain-containing protein n=1 Tax=Stachybotrys chartarum (strain CBS 109288 / IBT 7711) TaxID=1280523 RepID=A0A084BAF5_STACB|nr:hypothetical protein S7711_11538 [Stachybotrys chartarum IBT 7711]
MPESPQVPENAKITEDCNRSGSPSDASSVPVLTASPSPVFPSQETAMHSRGANASWENDLVSIVDATPAVRLFSPSVATTNQGSSMHSRSVEVDYQAVAASFHNACLDSGEANGHESVSPQASVKASADSTKGQGGLAKDSEQHSPSPNDLMYDPPSPGSPQASSTLGEKHQQQIVEPLPSRPHDAEQRARQPRRPRTPGKRAAHRVSGEADSLGEGTSESGDELHPQRKRRRVATLIHRDHEIQRNPTPLSKSGPRPTRQAKERGMDETAPVNAQQTKHDAIASYEEWPLSDAVLKCVRSDGMATFQLQFTWATSCMAHGSQDQAAAKHRQLSNKDQRQRLSTQEERSGMLSEGSSEQAGSPATPDDGADIYQVECILARWGKNLFFLRWSDGTTGWEPRRNILDKQLLGSFEMQYQGFDAGVDVVGLRTRAGQRQYCLRWHGRSERENSWVNEELMSPRHMERRASGTDTAHIQ